MSAEAKVEVDMSVFRDIFGGPAPTIFQIFSNFSDFLRVAPTLQFAWHLTDSRDSVNSEGRLPDSIGRFSAKFFGRRRKRRFEPAQGEVIDSSNQVVESLELVFSLNLSNVHFLTILETRDFSQFLELGQVLNSADSKSLSIWDLQQQPRMVSIFGIRDSSQFLMLVCALNLANSHSLNLGFRTAIQFLPRGRIHGVYDVYGGLQGDQ
jgi:hypothetical protein